jgi:DegT/DnrJ/EryC1/StrS aminotransferase family
MFDIINRFENEISEFFGSPYAVATDCCTHAVELCLRYTNTTKVSIPCHTYLSIPMTAIRLDLNWSWREDSWKNYYHLSKNIYDAAVLWKPNSYLKGTFMCVSFQFRKHLGLGRGGIILTDDRTAYQDLIKLSYDGRTRDKPWAEQKIESLGYHYYMTPETAQLGLEKLPTAKSTPAEEWGWSRYPDLRSMPVFKDRHTTLDRYLGSNILYNAFPDNYLE